MGIDIYVLNFLCHCYSSYGEFGRTLQLGRQEIHIGRRHRRVADRVVRQFGLGSSFAALSDNERYSETLFQSLGAVETVVSDISNYEGATWLHNYNEPLRSTAEGVFDTVFDGGSLEHIFNLPIALSNLMRATRVGGRILSVNGCNNFLGHGFYQLSPALMHAAFCPANGFKMLDAFFVTLDHRPRLVPVENPIDSPNRKEIGTTRLPTYLMIVAEKTRATKPFTSWPCQHDYVQSWAASRDNV